MTLLTCKRQPLPDFRMLMGLMLLPVLCVAIYYGVHYNDPDASLGGLVPLQWTYVENADKAFKNANKTLLAVPFNSGPTSFETMTNVYIQEQTNKGGEACSALTITIAPSPNYTYNAMSVQSWTDCFPEDVANAAKAAGFNLVLYQSPFKVAGYSALSVWRQNNAPIPVLELNFEAQVDLIIVANITASANPYVAPKNNGVMTFLSVVVAFLGALQVWVAIVKLLDLGISQKLNTKLWVCVLQIISGILRIVFSIDLTGYHHAISFPAFTMLLSFGLILVFATVFLVASAFHFAILAINKVKVANNKAFWALNAVVLILVGVSFYGAGVSAQLKPGSTVFGIVNAIIAAVFQVISGVYFVVSKRKVVKMLSLSASNKQAGRAQELKRMSVYLYLSMIPMLGFLAAMALYAERYNKRSPQIISIALAAMVSALTELTLICSFPIRQRRQEQTAPTEAGSAELHGRESSPRLSPRLSSNAGSI